MGVYPYSAIDLYQWEAGMAYGVLLHAVKEAAAFKKAAYSEKETGVPAYPILSWPDTLRAIGEHFIRGADAIERNRRSNRDYYDEETRAIIDAGTGH